MGFYLSSFSWVTPYVVVGRCPSPHNNIWRFQWQISELYAALHFGNSYTKTIPSHSILLAISLSDYAAVTTPNTTSCRKIGPDSLIASHRIDYSENGVSSAMVSAMPYRTVTELMDFIRQAAEKCFVHTGKLVICLRSECQEYSTCRW